MAALWELYSTLVREKLRVSFGTKILETEGKLKGELQIMCSLG